LSFFETAIAEYRRAPGSPLQLARALLNISVVKRLAALRRQNALDAAPAEAKDRREERARIERIRADARADLEESLAIYTRAHNHRGIAGALINLAFLHLDDGDLEAAESDAAEAFRHGEGKHDYIVMSRARTLQCAIENARMEEQIGDPGRLFETADAFAKEAVTYARQTQNRRLLARALITKGLTHSISPRGNRETARACAEQAIALTRHEAGEGEYVWDDLDKLKAAALTSTPVDATLRSWSAGIVGDKSFQQITEEFARLVIPRVWEREGRKISRVSARLSISPKKVRRILQDAGLTETGAASGPPSGAAG
jgi:tetratricopeptide (TPR) repeat protein